MYACAVLVWEVHCRFYCPVPFFYVQKATCFNRRIRRTLFVKGLADREVSRYVTFASNCGRTIIAKQEDGYLCRRRHFYANGQWKGNIW